MKWIIAYIAAAVAFGALDAVWLRWAADNLYRPVIGSIMADGFPHGRQRLRSTLSISRAWCGSRYVRGWRREVWVLPC